MAIKKDGEKIVVTVVLNKTVWDKARAEAERLGLNMSAYVRMILMQHHAQQKDKPG